MGEGERTEDNAKTDKGIITLLFPETSSSLLTCVFRHDPLGEVGGGEDKKKEQQLRCETKIKLIHAELSFRILLEFSS